MNITFAGAVKSGLKNYSNFKGTATRAEFWYFYLFGVLLNIVLSTFDSFIAPQGGSPSMMTSAGPLYTLVNIALVIPNLSIGIRRFHDAGFSAKWLLLWLLPVAVFFVSGGLSTASGMTLSADSSDAQVLAALAFLIPTILASAAVGVFQLVIQLLRTKTHEEGNKYAQPGAEPTGAGDLG